MTELRKTTVQVPERELELAQEFTGQGVTETVRATLRRLAATQAQKRLLPLRGKSEVFDEPQRTLLRSRMIAADTSSSLLIRAVKAAGPSRGLKALINSGDLGWHTQPAFVTSPSYGILVP